MNLVESPDEKAGDDDEKDAGQQLQEEAIEPDIELVEKPVMCQTKLAPLRRRSLRSWTSYTSLRSWRS